MISDIKTEVVVLGGGPGGYSAAFRAADLGKKVALVERHKSIGGVCLNVGCIPSKTLLHITKVIHQARHLEQTDIITLKDFSLNREKILEYKESVINQLSYGLKSLIKKRKIELLRGHVKFIGMNKVAVETGTGLRTINFDNAVIATGSSPIHLPSLPKDPRILNSTSALQMKVIPKKMLIIGGGIIGLEMAQIYNELGSKITIVEPTSQLIGSADADIIKPYEEMVSKHYSIYFETKVTQVKTKKEGLYVLLEGSKGNREEIFDYVLIAIGRAPNGKLIDAENAGVIVNKDGFIPVDNQLKTNIPHIFAVGDIIGQPMLAHKASAEGRIAAEVIAGMNHRFEPRCIPSVAYTNPEIAWVGLTEKEAKEKGIHYNTSIFPWAANGKSLCMGYDKGLTKILYNKNDIIIGAGIVGPNAGDLISEAALAIEMGCYAEDVSLTIHPHPTLSETLMMATEVHEGTVTDIYLSK